MWLEAPIDEDNGKGGRTRRSPGNQGTPQGGVLSPLLANIYMRRFLKAWEERGYGEQFQARIVNYADDFVILCRHTARQALSVARGILSRIGLTLNEEKTRTCDVWREPFDFLGYTFGVLYRPDLGKPYLGLQPSKTRVTRLKDKIRELTSPSTLGQSPEDLVGTINRVLRGWTGYFRHGSLRKAYQGVDDHVLARVRHWLVRKFKVSSRGTAKFPKSRIYGEFHLMSLDDTLSASRTPCR